MQDRREKGIFFLTWLHSEVKDHQWESREVHLSDSHILACLSFTVTPRLPSIYTVLHGKRNQNRNSKTCWKERALQELTASKTAGHILKSVHRVAKGRHAGESVNMTEMIQREKNKSLVLNVWQRLTGFESSLNTSAVSSLPQARKDITDLHTVIILQTVF